MVRADYCVIGKVGMISVGFEKFGDVATKVLPGRIYPKNAIVVVVLKYDFVQCGAQSILTDLLERS